MFSDPITIALYKSREAGNNTLVEDTVLNIDNDNIVDIRWRIHEINGLSQSSIIKWIVTLAHNDGVNINVYSGEIPCRINPKSLKNGFKKNDNSFGFDEYLIPQINDKFGFINKLNLYELEQAGDKDFFSARRLAVENFILGIKAKSALASELPSWSGEFQEG